jgi:hypothetical protein
MNDVVAAAMTYIFRWDRHGRKGEACKILARGTMNSCLVQFEDGYTMVTSRNALRTSRPRSQGAALALDCELEVCRRKLRAHQLAMSI